MIKRRQPRSDFLRFKGSPSVLGKKLFPYAIIIEVEKFRFECNCVYYYCTWRKGMEYLKSWWIQVKLEIGASFKRISLRVRNWARWIHSWINFEEHLQVGATFINTVSWRIDILFFLFISFFWNCFSLRWLEKIKIGSILDGRDSNIFRKSDEIEEESIEKFGK